jgi:omega-amidase
MMTLKIAIVQMEIDDGQKKENVDRALRYLEESKSLKPDIVCLPELFSTGYDLINSKLLAEPISGETMTKLLEFSEGNFAILGTFLEERNRNYYNCGFFVDNGQIIHIYRKIHLFAPMEEKKFLTPGNSISIFTFNDIKIGMGICYDLRFPEFFRKIASEGVKVIFLPSEFPEPKREVWKSLSFARSIENQCYFVAINRVGKGKQNTFFGNSLVADGKTIKLMNENPGIGFYTLDMDNIEELRKDLPIFTDRREDLY